MCTSLEFVSGKFSICWAQEASLQIVDFALPGRYFNKFDKFSCNYFYSLKLKSNLPQFNCTLPIFSASAQNSTLTRIIKLMKHCSEHCANSDFYLMSISRVMYFYQQKTVIPINPTSSDHVTNVNITTCKAFISVKWLQQIVLQCKIIWSTTWISHCEFSLPSSVICT